MLKLLEQVRRREVKKRNYISKTEGAYVLWIKRFIVYCGKKYPKGIL